VAIALQQGAEASILANNGGKSEVAAMDPVASMQAISKSSS
jgi:hypothetical protein